jgi:phage-related protein
LKRLKRQSIDLGTTLVHVFDVASNLYQQYQEQIHSTLETAMDTYEVYKEVKPNIKNLIETLDIRLKSFMDKLSPAINAANDFIDAAQSSEQLSGGALASRLKNRMMKFANDEISVADIGNVQKAFDMNAINELLQSTKEIQLAMQESNDSENSQQLQDLINGLQELANGQQTVQEAVQQIQSEQ